MNELAQELSSLPIVRSYRAVTNVENQTRRGGYKECCFESTLPVWLYEVAILIQLAVAQEDEQPSMEGINRDDG